MCKTCLKNYKTRNQQTSENLGDHIQKPSEYSTINQGGYYKSNPGNYDL